MCGHEFVWLDADGICYLELRDGEDVLYATIEKWWHGNESPCICSALGVRRDTGTIK